MPVSALRADFPRRDLFNMDLTKTFPRSPKQKMAGIVMLPRTIDKARAFNAGTLGEYHYDCPLDKEVFTFLGIDQSDFAKKADELSDDKIEELVRTTYLTKKTPADISKFNEEFLADAPTPNSESEARFLQLRNKLDPSRTDVVTWPDILDLEEGRSPRPLGV
jgi:hypothetical protein